MPILVECEACLGQFKVPDQVAGKKIKCPKCSLPISVPGETGATTAATPASPTPNPAAAPKTSTTTKSPEQPTPQWYVKTPDGTAYGPATKAELDQWVKDQRVTSDSQIKRPNTTNWIDAKEFYPELENNDPLGLESPSIQLDFGTNAAPVNSAGYQPQGGAQPASFGTPVNAPTASYGASYQRGPAKSKVTAGLLGIFLGGWGVHRFYLGFSGIGVAQIFVTLFTCGLGAWWGIIEGIMILTGSIDQDANGQRLRD